MPRENLITPIYYKNKNYHEIDAFINSTQFNIFKTQYIASIISTLDFYQKHAKNENDKRSVLDGLNRFKQRLFSSNPEEAQERHILFQGKKAMEDIAQALTPAEDESHFDSDEINEKLIIIYNLAGQDLATREVACLVCASGTVRNLIDTALLLSKGDLFDNIQLQRWNFFWGVINKYVLSTHRAEIAQRIGGHNHDTNLMNAFINAFSQEWDYPLITEIYVSDNIVTLADKNNIKTELMLSVTQDSITNKLAIDYLANIEKHISFHLDGTIKLSSANTAIERFEKQYGKHDVNVIFTTDIEDQLTGITSDLTAIKVAINNFMVHEKKNRKPPVNTFPLAWSEGVLIHDDHQGNMLWRSGDLFWTEHTDKHRDKTIRLPTVQELGKKYINEIGYSQLLQIINQNSDAESAAVFFEIHPQRLQATDNKQLSLFFAGLDMDSTIEKATAYAKKYSDWFNHLVKNNHYNPLTSLMLIRFNREKNAALSPEDICLQGMSLSQVRQFLFQLDPEESTDRATAYVTKHKRWFSSLVDNAGSNPLLPILLERKPHNELINLSPDDIILYGLSPIQIYNFLSSMDPKNSVRNAINYILKHKIWFNRQTSRIGRNPLAPLLLNRLHSSQLINITPDIILTQLSAQQTEQFFSKLDPTEAQQYVTDHERWFENLVSRIKDNPLFAFLVSRLTPQALAKVVPHIALQELSATQANRFFIKLTSNGTHIEEAIAYAIRYPVWFKELVARTRINPLVPLLEALAPEKLIKLVPDIILQGLSMNECIRFLSRMDPDKKKPKTVNYVIKHAQWFSQLVEKYRSNPLFIVLANLKPKTLMNIIPDVALQGLSKDQAKIFFSLLYPNTNNSRLSNPFPYAMKHRQWFTNLTKKNGENPLIGLLEQWKQEDLMKLKPDILLQGLSMKQAEQFFTLLNHLPNSKTMSAEAYATLHYSWFSELVARIGKNPLATPLLKYLLADELVKRDPNIAFKGLSAGQARDLFFKLAPRNGNMTKLLDYVTRHRLWFYALVKRMDRNPITNIAILHYYPQQLEELDPNSLLLTGLDEPQAERFLAKLDYPSDHEITKALHYIKKHPQWFSDIVTSRSKNPLTLTLIARKSPSQLAQLQTDDIALRGIDREQVQQFFTGLVDSLDYDLTHARTYAINNKAWLDNLIDKNGENPLTHLITEHPDLKSLLPEINPETDIALQGISASQAERFLLKMDYSRSEVINAQAYIHQHSQWFIHLVENLGMNPLLPLLTHFTREKLSELVPDIILAGLSFEQAHNFFAKLAGDSRGRVALAMTFAQTHKDWFLDLIKRIGANPLTPVLKEMLSSEQLVKQPLEIALSGLSKNQTRSFLAHMTPKDATNYVRNNAEWFRKFGWSNDELLLSNESNSVLSQADPLDISPANSWQVPKVHLLQNKKISRFTGQIIFQLENDPSVGEAAARLAGKQPETSVIVQLDINGNHRVVFGDLDNLAGDLRWQLVGHGRDGNNELNHQTLAGRSPQNLAEQLHKFRTDSGNKISPKHISLVGCSLTGDDTSTSYLHQFISSLSQQGIHPSSIGAYATQLTVNKQGQKRLTDTSEKTILTRHQEQWIRVQKPGKISSTGSGRPLLAALEQSQNFEMSMRRLYRNNGLSEADWLPMLHTLKQERPNSKSYSLTFIRKAANVALAEKKTVFTDDPYITNFIHEYDQQLTTRSNNKSEIEGINGLNTAFIIQTWFMQRARDTTQANPLPDKLKTALQIHTYANFTQMGLGALDDGVKFIQLAHELAQESSAVSGIFKTFSHFSTGAGVGMNLLNVGLDSYELAHAQNEAQQAMYSTQLAFDLASLGTSVVSLGAGMAGAATVSSFAGALAVPLAGLGIGITALVMTTQVHVEKTKAVGKYFALLDNGYAKGGYYKTQITSADGIKHTVWKNRPGIAISKIDLNQQKLTYGDISIYKTQLNGVGSGYINLVTMALPYPNKQVPAINIREGLDYPSPTADFILDKQTPLILPSNLECKISYDYQTFPGVTLRKDNGFPALRRLEKNHHSPSDNFSFDFYCFPSEYAISELKFEYMPTAVELFLDSNNRTIIMPSLSDQARGKMAYTLIGEKKGTYHISLQEGASLTLKGGSTATRWVLDARSLNTINNPHFDHDGRLHTGNMAINFANDIQGTLRLISQKGSFLINIPQKLVIPLDADVSHFKDWKALHNHLKQVSNTDFHNQPFIPVEDYLTSKGERVGRAFYETANDRFIYTNQAKAAEFLQGAQLAKIENNTAWFYRDSHLWQVNIPSGEVLTEFVAPSFEISSTPLNNSKVITNNHGNLCLVVEYQKASGPIQYTWQVIGKKMTLNKIAGNEEDLPAMNSPLWEKQDQFGSMQLQRGDLADIVYMQAKKNGHYYHSWLKKSEEKQEYYPSIQLHLAMPTPDDIQPIPIKMGGNTSYYFYSQQQQKLYFQPNDGLTQLTHQTDKAHEVSTNIQALFTMQEQLIAQHTDDTLWLADARGNLHLAGVTGNWLQAHAKNMMAQLRTLVSTTDTLPALRLQGLSDSDGKSIMAWYDITADKIILSGTGVEANNNFQYRGLSSDGKQAWLYDGSKGLLYRQPLEQDTQLILSERGKSTTTRLPIELWSSKQYTSVVSTGNQLRLTTKQGAVLLLPKSAEAQEQAQIIAWQVGKRTEAQLATAIESLHGQVIFAPTIRLLKEQEGQTPTWYLTKQKRFFRAHGLDGKHDLHWLGLAVEEEQGVTNAYIHDQTTGDLWLTNRSRSIANERYSFIFLLPSEQGNPRELLLEFAPSSQKKEIKLPKLKEVDYLTTMGRTEGARYLFDESILEHYQQISINEQARYAIIQLPNTLTHLSLYSRDQDLILYHQASNTRICIVNAEQAAEHNMKLQIGDIPAIDINHLVKEMYKRGVQIPSSRTSIGTLKEMELQVSPAHILEYYTSPTEQQRAPSINSNKPFRFITRSDADIARLKESLSALNLNNDDHGGIIRDNRMLRNEPQKLQSYHNRQF